MRSRYPKSAIGLSPGAPALILLVAVVVLALLLALVTYLSGRQPGEGSAEAGFVRDMSVHHAQAVEMAEIIRDRTESKEIRTLTADIALTQQAQIGKMSGWMDVWGLSPTGTEPQMAWMGHQVEGRMPGMASPEEINQLRNASPDEADKLFLRLMIPHHQAAIPMAEAILTRTDRTEVRILATSIAASQKAEVRTMKDMLSNRGGAPVESAPSMSMQHGGDQDQ